VPANSVCVVSGRPRVDFESVVSAAQSALSLIDAHIVEGDVFEAIAQHGFGIARADSYIAREITTLSFAENNGLVTCSVLSPSLIPYRAENSPLVAQVLPFVSDSIEDGIFSMFLFDSGDIRYTQPIEAFISKTEGLSQSQYLVDTTLIKTREDPLVPFEVEGMKSLSSFAIPYLKELTDASDAAEKFEDQIDGLIHMLQSLKNKPREMNAILELEYGPVFEYFWMSYANFMAYENERDRRLTDLYSSVNRRQLVIESPSV
jgi:hypothetical protein